jgi:hypothetical protein
MEGKGTGWMETGREQFTRVDVHLLILFPLFLLLFFFNFIPHLPDE